MKTIDVFGICLKDYSLKESLRVTEQYLNGGVLHTVICVTAGQLVKASSSEETKQWLEAADLVVFDDQDIIREAEGLDESRDRAAQNRDYLTGLFRKLARNRYGVYLLAQTPDKLTALEAEVNGVWNNLRIVGRGVLSESDAAQEQADRLINEINNVVPRVIIVRLPVETERSFLEQNKRKMNAGVFLGLSSEVRLQKKKQGFGRFTRYISRRILKRRVMHYIEKEKAGE